MFQLFKAIESDLSTMIELSRIKRLSYEIAQPQFWRYAEGAEKVQYEWFKELLARDDHLIFVVRENNEIIGFIIGRLLPAPEVYNPGGLTLMIDDFCITPQNSWKNLGASLLQELQTAAKEKGATQVLVVCGAHDEDKREFLQANGLQVASEWYVGEIKD